MTPFLRQVAAHYWDGQDIAGKCFVFPNRRSLVFFKKYLGDLVRTSGNGPIMVPPLCTINDFFYQVALIQALYVPSARDFLIKRPKRRRLHERR